MSRGMSKAERLQEMIWLYLQRGYSDIEMAERLGVDRTTAFRDRSELETEHVFNQDEQGRYRLERMQYMPNIKVNLHEALALYLATRRASRQTRIAQPHTASALEKLAIALKQPMTERLARAAGSILEQSEDPERVHVLEVITQGWAEQRKVSITHRALRAKLAKEHILLPYLIEPSLWSDGAYVIGYCETFRKVATFKIERIEKAELKLERFIIPEDFDEAELLRYAWGIWYGENEPTTVKLRFAPGEAARRVKESIWHPTQKLEELPDGGVIWQAQVAEWQEMLPWVRGWGADVEVLEPAELREELIQEASRLAQLYSVAGNNPKGEWLFWAKADTTKNIVHRLIYHLIDVGQVTLNLWKLAMPEQSRKLLVRWIGLDEDTMGRLLAFWSGLHDLGKAAPGFQRKYVPYIKHLEAAGFVFPAPSVQPARHGAVSTWALKIILTEQSGLSREEAGQVARALGGHHGSWPTPTELGPTALKTADLGEETWEEARIELTKILFDNFQPPQNIHLPEGVEATNAFLTLISGLTSTADWIGSMEVFFPYVNAIMPLEQYNQRAARQAENAIRKLGWVGWQAEGRSLTFEEMFPQFKRNLIQQAVIDATKDTTAPTLVILEAPTGSGKTEAALYLADTWLQNWQGRGLYIAMPTQATSNQMYQRVSEFLLRRYPEDILNLHLVHGAALLAEAETAPTEITEEGSDPEEGTVHAAAWFLPRKRTLLAPFGVGTVDQALMSVLQTRHFFVRLFGLGQKVVIFDEVHAYDTYMSVLFQQLLRWMKAIGTSVILLSATLPEATRSELARAWLGKKQIDLTPTDYPRLTVIGNEQASTYALPAGNDRTLKLEQIEYEPENIANNLSRALQDGGCAAVICNRVKRAQEIYQKLKEANIVPAENLILFHARFPFAWREEIEKKVLRQFGKGGERPKRAIIVATQVIEQSLDLDFDYMVSDFAPIDLLIQRAGRLQRHPQNDANRPSGLHETRMALAYPPMKENLPDFGRDERVYERAVLLRTWILLHRRTVIQLPAETSVLIESVYAEKPQRISEPNLMEAVLQADEKARIDRSHDISQAKIRIIARPNDEDLLRNTNQNLDEENPELHAAFRALTRLSEPGINLVCLHQTPDGLALEPDGSGAPVELHRRPKQELTQALLRHVVNVQHWGVVEHFLKQPCPSAWKEVSSLRYHYPVIFDEQGRCPLEGGRLTLVLSRETGLEVQKEAE